MSQERRLWYNAIMTSVDKKKIADILERHGVVVGYLFGSAARGTMGPHSDIDVAVLFDEKLSPDEQFSNKMKISDEVAKIFSIEQADVINLSTATDPLIKYIAVFSGEVIFERSKGKRFSLEQKVVRDYENTRELRRIARMVMKKQLEDGSFGRSFKTS